MEGKGISVLSKIDSTTFLSMLKSRKDTLQDSAFIMPIKPIPIQPTYYFFKAMENTNLEDIFDFNALDKLETKDIAVAMIDALLLQKSVEKDSEKLIFLRDNITRSKFLLNQFNEQLVVRIGDRGQNMVSLYLNSDEDELKRRSYYNKDNRNIYNQLVSMFSIAEKCGQSGSLLMRAIQVKKYYFTGLIARLQFPFVEDITGLMDTALEEQLMAVKLQPNTGFLHNELGILYQIKKDFEQAKVHFERAIQLEPKWAIPWTNLVVLYTKMGLKEEAEAASVKALGFQKNLFLTNLNIGVLQTGNKNLLLAEEYFRKSIALDNKNFLPFEKLAYAMLQTTQYAFADSLFKEAKIRKPDILNPSAGDLLLATSHNVGQAINDVRPVGSVNVASSFVLPFPGHEAPIVLQENDVLSNVVFGVRNFEDQKYTTAIKYFK